MSGTPLKFEMVGKTDAQDNEYFFTRPNSPCLVDLSKVVIFVHPYEKSKEEGGGFAADLVIKNYTPNRKRNGKQQRSHVSSDKTV